MDMKWTIALALSGLCLLSCNSEDPMIPTPDPVWVAMEPIQCLSNPWELDWLGSHNGDYSGYPKDPTTPGLEPEEFEIIRDYYDRQGVGVLEGETAPKYDVVCAACSCPEGHTLYLLVRYEDLQQMIDLGYREEYPE
jgi:hypothetical protein